MFYRLGWLACALVFVATSACDAPSTNSPVKTSKDPSSTPGVATKDAPPTDSAVGSQSSSPTPTQIEEGGVDENGEIVLRAADETATNAVSQSAAAQDAAEEPAVQETKGPSAELTSVATDSDRSKLLPVEANVVSDSELNQKIAEDWPKPQAVIFVSGQQHGYLEPCGCTGLDRQKGGLIRRDTLLSSLVERGWEVVPVDVGNQVRRSGRQAELKFKATSDSLKIMKYAAATLGIDDLKLSSVELLQIAANDDLNPSPFIAANLSIIDPSFFPATRVVEAGGRKIGITAFLGKEHKLDIQSNDIEFFDPVDKLKPAIAELKQSGCDFVVLLAHASIEESNEVAKQLSDIDLVVTAGGFGEPTFEPEPIEGTSAVMVQVGVKGMYGGIVGLFDDAEKPIRYQRIAISAQFKDSPRMLERFAEYQKQLEDAGFDALGATPLVHSPPPPGRQFVGSEACAECHAHAYEVWKGSPHFHATESIVNPPNDRGGIQRHFDPECVSCHVTGWDPQKFQPFVSGYESLEKSELLLGSGCENCHGPGSEHVAAENGDIDVDNETLIELQQSMVLPLDLARDKCLECHDLDNSPDFHIQPHEETFSKYWEQIKHYED